MTIRIETTGKELSCNGGLFVFDNIMALSLPAISEASFLPQLQVAKENNGEKFRGLLLGFAAGAECLDDMDTLNDDVAFAGLSRKIFTAKSYGNFLRSFTDYHLKMMSYRLADLSFQLRLECIGHTSTITFDLDSTSNRQYGKKMEGVESNYKGIPCLDTIKAFDEYGFPYWLDVRPGATDSAQDCEEIIHAICSRIPKSTTDKGVRVFIRADSAFCRASFFEACFVAQSKFVVCFRQNMFEPIADQVHRWHSTDKKDPGRLRFYDGRECEYGETIYQPEGSHRIIRVITIRAEKKDAGGPLFKDHKEYDYYSWGTNIGSEEWSIEEVIKFYRKRGNAENFIRELKYGFELKHYPCQKLRANKAYGITAAYSHAFMRYLALTHNKKNPHFAKLTRSRLIQIPCQIVRHARNVVFRFMIHHYEEVQRTLRKIKFQQNMVYANLSPPKLSGRSLKT